MGLVCGGCRWERWCIGEGGYHARRARGLDERTWPIVLGRVPCSRAYARPLSSQVPARARDAFWVGDRVLGSGWSRVVNRFTVIVSLG